MIFLLFSAENLFNRPAGRKKKKHDHHHGHNHGSSININIDTRKMEIQPKGKHNHKIKGKHGHHGANVTIHFEHELGNERAEKARKKHHKFKPKKEKEAHTEIKIIMKRNHFLVNETHDKIELARKKNKKKRDAGSISVTVFNNNIRFLDSCEERRTALKIKVKG